MQAGRLDRRIIFETSTPGTPSGSGEVPSSWGTYFESWSERRDLRGRELFAAQQVAAKGDVMYRIPYPHGKTVTPREGLRILDQGRPYDITHVAEVGKRGREGLEILAYARAE